ncbi:MAG: sarcosine oxidase [Frankiales bacterium]|jgi:sarcosine oxidase|nr:sarcosine oxidase [Frankiales bacterium]
MGSSYLVLGAGLVGAATAWELARRGLEVTVVERAVPAHHGGSSHGSARILRYGYPDPFYVRLVQEARTGWDELESRSGRRLLTLTGALDFGDLRGPEQLARVFDEAGVEHTLLTADEASARWPQIRFDSAVLWHPAAGVIDAESAVTTMVELAVRDGAQLLTNWTVTDVLPTTRGYRVVADDGRWLEAERVVVAAGGWLPQLLPRLPLPEGFVAAFPALQVRQEQPFHFPYRPGFEPAAGASWPCFIHQSPAMLTYGLPGGRDAGFRGHKVAEYNGGKVIGSAADQDGVIDEAALDRLVALVERSYPGLLPEPYAGTTCIFTNTPDEDFVIDGVDGITVVSPCSGHGAKFAPAVGRLAADVATGVAPARSRFSVHR